MKRSYSTLIPLLLFAAATVAGQTKPKPRPTSFIETRQANHFDGPDVSGHGKVSQGDTLLCMMASMYDDNSSTACVIRIGDGPKQTLGFNQSMRAPKDGEAYLECSGHKPRRCMIEVNPGFTPSPEKYD